MLPSFNEDGCFVENFKDRYKLVAKGNRVQRMFTINVKMPKVDKAMYEQGSKVVVDVDI